MRLSRAVTYAIHAIVHLAAKPDQVVNGQYLAKTLHIPQGFLLRTLVSLSRSRILWSLKGPNGGYRLARPAKAITLLDVIEAVDGPLQGHVATFGLGTRVDRRLVAILDEATGAVRLHLQQARISDLAGKSK